MDLMTLRFHEGNGLLCRRSRGVRSSGAIRGGWCQISDSHAAWTDTEGTYQLR